MAVYHMLPTLATVDTLPNTMFSTVNEKKRRSLSMTMDDSMVDYMSMMGIEDRKRRFSEDVADMEVKDSERMKKLYRQFQRQVNCSQENKVELLTVIIFFFNFILKNI